MMALADTNNWHVAAIEALGDEKRYRHVPDLQRTVLERRRRNGQASAIPFRLQ